MVMMMVYRLFFQSRRRSDYSFGLRLGGFHFGGVLDGRWLLGCCGRVGLRGWGFGCCLFSCGLGRAVE
jgi:hypothetical protein